MIALHYIYMYIYSYMSRRILTVKAAGFNPHFGRGCLTGGAEGWCPSTIVLHIFWVTKYLYYIFKCTFSFTLLYFQILQWIQARQNIEDDSTRPILSATCVGTSQQLHSVEPSLPSSEPPTFTILTVKLVIRTCLGLHTSVVNPATMD